MGKASVKEIIKGVRRFKKESKGEFGIEKIIIFGSAARGEMKEDSDIDLILVSRNFAGKSFFDRPIGLRKFWTLHYPVDFLCYSPEEFKKEKRRVSIVSEAIREGLEV